MSDGLTPDDRRLAWSAKFRTRDTVRLHYLALLLLLPAILLVFGQTFGSMLDVWLHSATFLHGILIFPISAYLVWLKRRELSLLQPTGYWPAAFGLLILSLVWWFADALGVQVVQQLVVTAMITAAVIAVMGPRFAGCIAFPLGYLFFAVPVGELLVPYLMDYTAAFTVKALNISGIPVFREGRYFSIPAGNFEVARACSGIRYLLAALALGTLFAYMIFRDARKRAFFVLFSIVMPIVANGLRAYGIVLLAQFVSLELATGVDHVIFGWIFFGILIIIMFAIGNRFSDRDPDAPLSADSAGHTEPGVSTRATSLIALFGVSVACIVAGPLLAMYYAQQSSAAYAAKSGLPSVVPGWVGKVSEDAGWRPDFRGADYQEFARYENTDSELDVAIVRYQGQRQGGELANSENAVVNTRAWRLGNSQSFPVPLRDGDDLMVNEVIVMSQAGVRTVWFWYDIDGKHALSTLQIKLFEAARIITGSRPISSAIIISVDNSGDIEGSRELLAEFVQVAFEPMTACMSGHAEDELCDLKSHSSGAR